MALLVEVNSIFLHTRQLLIIQGAPRQHSFYRLNSLLNIGKRNFDERMNNGIQLIEPNYLILGTFLIFRIVTLGWMTRWLVVHRDQVPFFAYTCGSVGKLYCQDILIKHR